MSAQRRHALRHIVLGIRYGYPPCCVIRFVAESVARPDVMQGVRRGVIRRPERDSMFVPCGIFHHGQALAPPVLGGATTTTGDTP